ncbi:MAG: hypothetical protein RSD88_07490 [Anaerovoracaceae bacterium]
MNNNLSTIKQIIKEQCKPYNRHNWINGDKVMQIIDRRIAWIPVKDREPEHDGLYLVCMDDEFITTTEYCTQVDGRQDWDLWEDSGEVIAWQLLPEPYKEG